MDPTKLFMDVSWNSSDPSAPTDTPQWSLLKAIICLMLYGVLMFLVILGNGFLLFVTTKVADSKRTTRIFIGSLTVADLMVGGVVIPLRVTQLIGGFFGHDFASGGFCKVYFFLEVLFVNASILALLCLTIERYLAIEMPLRFRAISTSRRSCYVVICTWILSVISACTCLEFFVTEPGFLVYFDGNSSLCVFRHVNSTDVVFILFMTCYLIVPLCVTVLASVRILWIAKQHTEFQNRSPGPTCTCPCRLQREPEERRRACHGLCRGLCKCFLRNKRALVTVLLVTVSYIASSVPHIACGLYVIVSPGQIDVFPVELGRLSLLASCFLNVVVYTTRIRTFRASAKRLFRQLIPSQCRQKTHRESQSSSSAHRDSSSATNTFL